MTADGPSSPASPTGGQVGRALCRDAGVGGKAPQGRSDTGSGLPLKPPPRAPRGEPNPHLLPTQPSLVPAHPRPSHWGPRGLPRAPVTTLWRLEGSPCPLRRASSRSCRPPRLWPCSWAPGGFSLPVFACAEPSSGRSVRGCGVSRGGARGVCRPPSARPLPATVRRGHGLGSSGHLQVPSAYVARRSLPRAHGCVAGPLTSQGHLKNSVGGFAAAGDAFGLIHR